MKISRKITGLTVAGVVAAGGAAYAAVETTSSAPTVKNVSSSHRYGSSHSSSPDRSAGRHDSDDRSRSSYDRRTPKMWMSGYFAVVHGHERLAVTRLVGHHWRTVGWLRWNDRHVRGVWWPYRYTTTVIIVLNRRTAVTIVVRPGTVIVIADNGRVGIVPARYLRRWTPHPTMSPSMTPTPTMTPPANGMSPTPTPTGSQSSVVGGLQGRSSSKW